MRAKLRRRSFLAGTAAAALPMPSIAQNKPIRIGLLTVKTGPLAQGGIQMEQGTNLFLKDRNNMLAGRKVELMVGDTGGNPAGTKTKAQELIERDNVDMIFGPLAAFELLAISDYVAAHKTPILSLAAAEDMTQRKPNPYFVRASGTSAQNMHPLADYRREGAEVQERHHHQRGFRLRLRADGRLPARVRGCRRPRGEKAVAADRHARLHALHRAAQRRRCGGAGLCRLESAEVHEAVQGCRCHAAGARRRHRGRRCAAQELRRRGDRAGHRVGLHAPTSIRRATSSSSPAWCATPAPFQACMPPACTSMA